MKRDLIIKNISFHIGNYTPRKNEFEKGCKYKLYVDGIPTGYIFSTIKRAKTFIEKNYFIWM